MNELAKKKPHSRNALVHGLYAKDVLLPWDSKGAFEKLHCDLKIEFSPRGRAEKETVLDLALTLHRKHTLWRMQPSAVLRDPLANDIVQTECKSWHGIRKELRAQAREGRSLMGVCETSISKLQANLKRLQKKLESSSDREEIKELEHKISVCIRTLAEHASLLKIAVGAPDAEKAFDSFYAPESIEKIIRIEAALDARITKILGRLVGLKEFKRTAAGGGSAPPLLEVSV
jgi:hypothetical protein